jgi:ribosomal protein S18 acetylase RimI-like enzyme
MSTSAAIAMEVKKIDHTGIVDAFELIEEYYNLLDIMVRDNRDVIAHYVAENNSGIWVAYEVTDGKPPKPVGCVLMRPLELDNSVEVKRLYVRPGCRGAGVAQLLMKELELEAKLQGNHNIYLDTKDDLIAAINFYRRFGYIDCERYNDNPQATIFMRKSLL